VMSIHATFMVTSSAFPGTGLAPVTKASLRSGPEAATTVGAANGATAELLEMEQTRLAPFELSNSADQQAYWVPPTSDVPSASLANCSGSSDAVTLTHPVAPAAGQAPSEATHATLSVVAGFGGSGCDPVTASWAATVPGAATTVGGLISVFVETAVPASQS